MLGTTASGQVLRVRVNDDGELVINLEAATVNIGDVDILSTPADATFGSAVPLKGVAIAGSDGTNARMIKTTTDGTVVTQLTGSNASAYESVTIDDTAGGVGLTAAAYGTKTRAMITVETATFRYRIDGVAAPTASVGHQAQVGDVILLTSNEDIAGFRGIRDTGTSATIHVTYSN